MNNDINNFILLLRKGSYPYDYLPEKDDFYSNLNMGVTDLDYNHAKSVCHDFEI